MPKSQGIRKWHIRWKLPCLDTLAWTLLRGVLRMGVSILLLQGMEQPTSARVMQAYQRVECATTSYLPKIPTVCLEIDLSNKQWVGTENIGGKIVVVAWDLDLLNQLTSKLVAEKEGPTSNVYLQLKWLTRRWQVQESDKTDCLRIYYASRGVL